MEELSLLLLELLEEEASNPGAAIAATALTLARLTSSKQPLEQSAGHDAVKVLMDFCHAFHAGGGLN